MKSRTKPGPWELRDALTPTDLLGGLSVWALLLFGSFLLNSAIFQMTLSIVAAANTIVGLYVAWVAAQRGRSPALWVLLSLLLGFIALARIRQIPVETVED